MRRFLRTFTHPTAESTKETHYRSLWRKQQGKPEAENQRLRARGPEAEDQRLRARGPEAEDQKLRARGPEAEDQKLRTRG